MTKVSLGSVLKEERNKIGQADGNGLNLIGVSNEYGLHISRAARIANLSRYQIIKKDWFAYNPMRVNVGSIGIALKPEDEGIVSPDYVVFSCTVKILPDYLQFFLKSDIGLEAIEKNASGAVRKRLYFSDLAKIELNVPSISEQAKKLGSIQKIETIVKQLKDPIRLVRVSQLKQSILQDAIQGKLTAEWRAKRQIERIETEPASELLKRIQTEKVRLIKEKNPSTTLRASIKKEKSLPLISEEEKPFELPEGWEWCRLGGFSNVGTGGTPLTSNKSYYENGDIPWVTSSVTGKLFAEEPERYITKKALMETNCSLNPIGTLVIAMYGQGKTSGQITELNFESTTNQACATINPFLDYVELRRFVKLYFREIYLEIRKLAQGGAQPNLNIGKIKNTIIPIPPLEEQKAIVEKVESLMAKCSELETEINQSEQYAQQLMQAVLKEAFER